MSSLGFNKNNDNVAEPDLSDYFEAINPKTSEFLSDVKDLELPDEHFTEFSNPTEPKQRGDNSFENDFGDDDGVNGAVKPVTSSEVRDTKNRFEMAKMSSNVIINIVDGIMTRGSSFIAGEEVPELSSTKKKELSDAFANWIKDFDFELSPGWLFAFAFFSAYGPMYYDAFEVRKLKKKNEKNLSEIERLKKENELLKRENAIK